MKKKLCAFLLALGLLCPTVAVASAADLDLAPVEADLDIGVIAGDSPDVGEELEPEGELPTSFSNREYASEVRSQRFNTCWAYSACAVAEVVSQMTGFYGGWFSPMIMNYWATVREDGTGWQRSYTGGGYPYIAIGFMTAYGLYSETDFPAETNYDDYSDDISSLSPLARVNSMVYLSADDIDSTKAAIYQYGSAVGNFHQENAYFNTSKTAYFCDIKGLATKQLKGHAVAIVGWDDDYSRENFGTATVVTDEFGAPVEDNEGNLTYIEEHRPEHNGAWLCKNSWGPGWNELGGYFWISYEDEYLFDKRFGPSYAIIGLEPYDENTKLCQNDQYGTNYEFNYVSDVSTKDKLTYINVFDFTDNYLNVDKIVFESTAVGSDYDLHYIPLDENGVPLKDESTWTLLGSGTVEYKGYHAVDIEDSIVPRGKGGIGVTVKKTEISSAMTIGSCEWIRVSGQYVFKPDAKSGQCYLIGYGSKVWDLMDFYEQKVGEPLGGILAIKAYTKKVEIMGDVDLDNILTIVDVTCIQRYIADLAEFTDEQKKLADYDGDGDITIIDCTKIQRVLADIEPPLYPLYI